MKRHLILAIGLLSTILGLTVLVDTALADGCCCCCCCSSCPFQQASSIMTPCASSVTTCDSYDNNQTNCISRTVFANNVNNFPKCCVSSALPPGVAGPPGVTMCNQELADCTQRTTCTYKSGDCQPSPSTDAWKQNTSPTTRSCK